MRRLACATLGLLLATGALGTAAASAAAVAPSQEVATLGANHTIYVSPGGRGEAVIPRYRPITGEATTLPVLAVRQGRHNQWLLVRLPGRLLPGSPNGRTGWIKSAHTRLWTIRWRIFVSPFSQSMVGIVAFTFRSTKTGSPLWRRYAILPFVILAVSRSVALSRFMLYQLLVGTTHEPMPFTPGIMK